MHHVQQRRTFPAVVLLLGICRRRRRRSGLRVRAILLPLLKRLSEQLLSAIGVSLRCTGSGRAASATECRGDEMPRWSASTELGNLSVMLQRACSSLSAARSDSNAASQGSAIFRLLEVYSTGTRRRRAEQAAVSFNSSGGVVKRVHWTTVPRRPRHDAALQRQPKGQVLDAGNVGVTEHQLRRSVQTIQRLCTIPPECRGSRQRRRDAAAQRATPAAGGAQRSTRSSAARSRVWGSTAAPWHITCSHGAVRGGAATVQHA